MFLTHFLIKEKTTQVVNPKTPQRKRFYRKHSSTECVEKHLSHNFSILKSYNKHFLECCKKILTKNQNFKELFFQFWSQCRF